MTAEVVYIKDLARPVHQCCCNKPHDEEQMRFMQCSACGFEFEALVSGGVGVVECIDCHNDTAWIMTE